MASLVASLVAPIQDRGDPSHACIPSMKLSDAQKEAIRAYNTESGSSLSLRFSFLRVAEYNRVVFEPQGVPLLPLPTPEQLQKAAIDDRHYSKKTSRIPMGRGDTPSGRGRGRGRGGSKTPMSLLDMPMIAQPLFSINTGVLEALIEKAVTKAVEKAVTKAVEELVVPLLNKVTPSSYCVAVVFIPMRSRFITSLLPLPYRGRRMM